MSWFTRIANVISPNRLSRDLDRELSFHIAERTEELVAHGTPREEAQRQARRQFGNYSLQKEATRDRDVFRWLETLIGDLRYAIRTLRAAPGFALVAILSLALGIGANTAIFSLINAVMLKSLPVRNPEQLVVVLRGGPEVEGRHAGSNGSEIVTNPIWEYIRDHQDVFSGVLAYSAVDFNLANGGEARRMGSEWVSGGYFTTLGVGAVLGRTLLPADDVRGCPAVAAISESLWRAEYGASPSVIGRMIPLNGHPFQIVGVINGAFSGLDVGTNAQIYAPLCAKTIVNGNDKWVDARSNWYLRVVGRPRPGLTTPQMNARLAMLVPGLVEATMPPNASAEATADYRKAHLGVTSAAKGFSTLRPTFRKALLVLMAIVGLVLLIACANVANLLLARATTRRHEIAVRLALGARPARLIRQLLTESMLLSFVGAAVGIFLAVWGGNLLVHLMSTSTDAVALDLSIDTSVLAFTAIVAVATGVLFGLAPAWGAARVAPQAAMKAQGRGLATGHSRLSFGKTLVVAQIALSLVLIAGATLLVGSWRRLVTIDPGFNADHLLLVSADISGGKANMSPSEQSARRNQFLDRLRAVPGAQSVSVSLMTPVSGSTWNDEIKAEGFAPSSRMDDLVWINSTSPGYFATMGTRLVSGRDFNTNDAPGSAKVAIVNEAMARKVFGSGAAIGKTFQIAEGRSYGPQIEVVGVVANTKYVSMDEQSQPIAYLAMEQDSTIGPYVNFEVRTTGPTNAIIPSVKAAMGEIDPRVSLTFSTLDRQISESLRLPRTLATLAGFFGALALLLAVIGLYGIMSYNVARRRNEIGVRIALGATQGRVVQMVMGEVGRVVAAGLVVGLLLTLGATRFVSAFLYGVTAQDPVTMIASAVVLATVAILAAMAPAWRAARMDPVSALRDE